MLSANSYPLPDTLYKPMGSTAPPSPATSLNILAATSGLTSKICLAKSMSRSGENTDAPLRKDPRIEP